MDNFQPIIDALGDVIFVHHSVTGKIEYINKTCVDFYGYSSEELMEHGLQLIVAKDDAFDFNKQLELLEKAAKGEVLTFDWKTMNAAGKEFWVEVTLKRAFVSDGVKVVATVRDISPLKKVLEAYSEREYLLESINKNVTDGIFRTKANAGFVYINNALVKIFGYDSIEEMMEVNPKRMYANSSYRRKITEKLIIEARLDNQIIEFRRKDGTTFWGSVSSIYSNGSNQKNVIDGVLKDITKEKKDAEKLESLNEELIERNFELDQLVYKTSHDLRSPLRSVLGLTNLMKAENAEIHTEFIERIEDRILKMDEFIKSMLNYSRASRLELKNETVDFPELIAACCDELEYVDGFANFKINETYTGDIEMIKLDKLRLSIICCNLISNAFKYRNTALSNSYLNIKVGSEKKWLKVEFIDNGIGIAKEYLNNVFEMFFRATENAEGSGLGMYIVKQAVIKLKGQISIESTLGKGTSILIKVPLHT